MSRTDLADRSGARDNDAIAEPRRQLSLADSVAIIVGIIVGSGIYETTPGVAQQIDGVGTLMAVWLAGAVVALTGALCYAELVTAYPREGGDFVYLTRAFGRPAGFFFGWSGLWIVRPGAIGAVAYVFARYAQALFPLPTDYSFVIYAALAVLATTGVNLLGVRQGKWTQNVLTAAKVLGLTALFAAAVWPGGERAAASPGAAAPAETNLALAMIFVLFTYGGWNEMAYVGAEVRDPQRNVLRALLLGTATVATLYLAANLAFVQALGFDGLRQTKAAAADAVRPLWPTWGPRLVSLLICVSALGTVNGSVFTGARIFYAMGREHRIYRPLGHWHRRLDAPVASLLVQAAVTLVLVVVFGPGYRSFERLVVFCAPPVWLFLLAVGLALFVLRWREAGTPRRFRVPLYPLTPLVYCAACLGMLVASVRHAAHELPATVLWPLAAVMAVGLILAPVENRWKL